MVRLCTHSRGEICLERFIRFDSDRNADQTIGDPGALPFLLRHHRVRSVKRDGGEAFDAAQRNAARDHLEPIVNLGGSGDAAFHFESQHESERFHVLACDVVIRMVREAWIMNSSDFAAVGPYRVEKTREPRGILGRSASPKLERRERTHE